MTTIAISEFKAKCLAIVERVRLTGQPILITRRGKPVAQLLPPPLPEPPTESRFGCMAGTTEEVGDILEPVDDLDWEVFR